MNKPFLILILSIFLLPGCASFGPTVMIQTEQPEQDFVVVCTWAKQPLLAVHGGHQEIKRNVYVTDSNEEVNCGLSLWGAAANSQTMHPLYWGGELEIKEGVRIVKPQTKLHHLDELKQKFESGFWDQDSAPGFRYADSAGRVCGFPNMYFKYYSEAGYKIDVEHFKRLYHESMLECFKKTFPLQKKYKPRSSKTQPSAEEWMDRLWKSKSWETIND